MANVQVQPLISPRRVRNVASTGHGNLMIEGARSQVDGCAGGARRILYVVLAAVFFVLAIIGVVLPGLPTTPFLLLTSYFLSRSWPRMHQRLMDNKVFGPILRRFQRTLSSPTRQEGQAA